MFKFFKKLRRPKSTLTGNPNPDLGGEGASLTDAVEPQFRPEPLAELTTIACVAEELVGDPVDAKELAPGPLNISCESEPTADPEHTSVEEPGVNRRAGGGLKEFPTKVKHFFTTKLFRKAPALSDGVNGGYIGEPGSLPLQVIVGYFPGVTEKDALEYAQGVAAKHFTQPSMVHFGAFKFDTGYLYEVHEGGLGRAYCPTVIKQFEEAPAYAQEVANVAVIQTATRLVEIQRKRDGVSAVLLPESATRDSSLYIQPTKKLRAAVNDMARFHEAANWVFKSGLCVLVLTGLVFRVTPFDLGSAVKVEAISASQLPRTQWSALVNTPAGYYVKSIRFANGKWASPELSPADPEVEAAFAPVSGTVPNPAVPMAAEQTP